MIQSLHFSSVVEKWWARLDEYISSGLLRVTVGHVMKDFPGYNLLTINVLCRPLLEYLVIRFDYELVFISAGGGCT